MSTGTQTANGWRSAMVIAGLITPLTAFGLQVGTGGAPTESYYKQRGNKGYPYVHYESLPANTEFVSTRSPSENLSRIREVLKPSVTELANLFGVSRQAVYDWQSGKPTSDENATKLEDLAKAADVFIRENLTASSQVLRRKIAGGQTLFDVVREGGSAENAASMLAQMVRRESEQRKALDARLANRKKPIVDYVNIGAPMLDERA
jgi:transcriptional regulator with XRE-family HTH domain